MMVDGIVIASTTCTLNSINLIPFYYSLKYSVCLWVKHTNYQPFYWLVKSNRWLFQFSLFWFRIAKSQSYICMYDTISLLVTGRLFIVYIYSWQSFANWIADMDVSIVYVVGLYSTTTKSNHWPQNWSKWTDKHLFDELTTKQQSLKVPISKIDNYCCLHIT